MPLYEDILKSVLKIPFIDTHEHLLEESTRINPPPGFRLAQCCRRDFSVLFSDYVNDDLLSAGMPRSELDRFLGPELEPADKWKLVAPYYERARHTGYCQNVRESVRLLFGEEDVNAGNVLSLSDKIAARIRPGFYEKILRETSLVEYAQVHTQETPVFMETRQPELLQQDILLRELSTQPLIDEVSALSGLPAVTLDDWHKIIDWCFETFGPRAIAAKYVGAYQRGLDFSPVETAGAAPLFARYAGDRASLSAAELKALQDHLFHYCVRRAIDFKLPVKFHMGYYSGVNVMPLNRLRSNAGDLSELLMAYPGGTFVLMHMNYPYQDEAIALAKHFTNVYADMCWAWIVNPLAGVRFIKEFLTAAPASKLLTFGGDYLPVEMVPGHACMARKGLAQAVAELIREEWLNEGEALLLLERVMRGNARELFDYEGKLKHWS